MKELYFNSQLRNCPFSLRVGPMGQGRRGKISFSVDPMHWDNQPLTAPSYFSQILGFFRVFMKHPWIRVRLEIEGQTVLDVHTKMKAIERFAPFIVLLDVMEKAQYLARRFKLNPAITPTYLAGHRALRAIELAYVVFKDGRYELPAGEDRFSVPVPKYLLRAAKTKPELLTRELTILESESTLPFFGHDLPAGSLAWHFPGLVLDTPADEVQRLCEGVDGEPLLAYRTAPGTQAHVGIVEGSDLEELELRVQAERQAWEAADENQVLLK